MFYNRSSDDAGETVRASARAASTADIRLHFKLLGESPGEGRRAACGWHHLCVKVFVDEEED
jgi:hypothetical protein